ncbi:protein O-GlcNAcase [Anguilla rostrata]|uniref:protein O-GlcNAcase n=1 Tax=Anguilla rostrata TaxID=7938 RepID=UPI0030CE0F9A
MEDKSEFLCGVVEGFYGRPWSVEQRKVLFQWMQRWGLNTYLYGPKDDLKHRLLWRELYSPEEEAQLKTLVREAEFRGLRFVYALSPGQDMVFSSSCDLTLLKRKLRQVTELGCQAFALLFDDIDHSLSQADSEAFSSFAHAQVSVANEIFRFLGEPSVFLFCPTEYCGSLCSPSVAKSPYLLTVGEDLLPGISVIWTGSKVISRELSADSLVEVQNVLQRPLLVWDNLHANDYDSRRVFLGPFKGRPPSLRSQLRGLLLNPNCEFEANYIPLHTLGHWHRTGAQILKGGAGQYCPEEALSAALQDWMEELSQPLQPGVCVCVCACVRVWPCRRSSATHTKQAGRDMPRDKERAVSVLHHSPSLSLSPCLSLSLPLPLFLSLCLYPPPPPPPQVEEWRVRAGRFLAACDDVARLHVSVVNSVNRAVLYDLYPYIWDLRNTVLVAKAFVSWLDGRVLNDTQSLSSWRNCFHWCGVAMGADVLGVESEPWVFKGGLSGEVQMLLPIGTSTELFTHPPPLFPTCRLYNIRPFQLKDKVELYRMVRQLHLKTQGKQDSAQPHPDLIGDRYLGASLALCPEYSFVLEDELGVCGGALGVLDVRSFSKRYQASWLPAMRDKYPTRPHGGAQEALLQFQEEQADYPDSLLYHFPSQVWLDALPELVDCSLTRSLLTALLTALKANGSQGVFCDVLPTDRQRLELLAKLGFLEILRGEARPREGVVLGRLL